MKHSPSCCLYLGESNSPTLWTFFFFSLWSLCLIEEYTQRLFPWLSLLGIWQLEACGSWYKTIFLGCLRTFADLLPVLVLVKASLGMQLGPSCILPGPAEAATNCWLVQLQTASQGPVTGSVLYWAVPESLPRGPEPTYSVATLRQYQRKIQ